LVLNHDAVVSDAAKKALGVLTTHTLSNSVADCTLRAAAQLLLQHPTTADREAFHQDARTLLVHTVAVCA